MSAGTTGSNAVSFMRLDNGHVLGATALIAPAIGVFAPLALAPLAVIAALAAVAVARLRDGAWPSVPRALAVLLAAVIVWSAVSIAWAPSPRLAAAKLGELALLFAAFLVVIGIGMALERMQRVRVERLLVIGCVLAIALLFIELVAGYPIRHLERAEWTAEPYLWRSFDRGSAVLAILVWPAARALWRRSGIAAIALWLATAALVVTLSSATAKLAFAAGLVAFLIARVAPRATAAALATILAIAIVAAPLLAARIPSADVLAQHWPFNAVVDAPGKSSIQSGMHRLLIWRFTAGHVAEKPLTGWGFNASRWLPGGEAMVTGLENAMPLHPHNMALQWWVELGLPGALLGAATAVLALRAIRRVRERLSAATGAGLAGAAATVAFMSFGAWQSWWLATLALAAAFYAATARGDTAHP